MFGEDHNDRQTVKELLLALGDDLPGIVQKARENGMIGALDARSDSYVLFRDKVREELGAARGRKRRSGP